MTLSIPRADVPPVRSAAAALVVLALAACSPDGSADPLRLSRAGGADGTVFLTLDASPGVWMEALAVGPVERDAAGCLRLGGPDRHTVVWPMGFRLAGDGDDLRVVDAGGRVVGPVGGSFRLSGGEVATLHDGLPISEETRAEAEARCPGRYWLVGEQAEAA